VAKELSERMNKLRSGITICIASCLPIISVYLEKYLPSKLVDSAFSIVILILISLALVLIGHFFLPNYYTMLDLSA